MILARTSRTTWTGLASASALAWAYWPTLARLQETWSRDSRYSHGPLVPLFSLYLLWSGRERLAAARGRGDAGGLGLIVLGVAMHLAGGATNQDWVGAASLLPSLAGLCALAAGWRATRVAWPSIAFLVFMIPLPYSVERTLGLPLQRLATRASTLVLQTAGFPALEEGNTINLGRETIGVVDACNGIGIGAFFFAISVGLVLVVRRPRVERALILAGAIPIALVANVARIATTGLLVESFGHSVAGVEFHDLAGYLMMPFALAMLCLENALLDRLFVETTGT